MQQPTESIPPGATRRNASGRERKQPKLEAVEATAGSEKRPSKQERLAAMLVRDEGATLDQMVESTGWLPHTVRAALTGLKKKGYALSSDKLDGMRTYRAVPPQ